MARSHRSDSTASSASEGGRGRGTYEMAYRDAPLTATTSKSAYRFRDDSEEALQGFEDVEERVGLMQRDRQRSRGIRLSSPTGRSKSSRWPRCNTFVLVLLAVLVCLPLSVSILAWLASSTSMIIPGTITTEQLSIPAISGEETGVAVVSPAKKVASSTNDAAGQYGLAGSQLIQFNEVVQGWSTPAEADAVLGLPAGTTQKELVKQGRKDKGLKSITMDNIFNHTFQPKAAGIEWSKEDPDKGVFIKRDPDTYDIILEDVTHARKNATGKGEVAQGGGRVVYVQGKDIVDYDGKQLKYSSFVASPDLSHFMFFVDTVPVWRWSKKSNVWIYRVSERKAVAIGGCPHKTPEIAHAAWIPRSPSSLAYVQKNDLYVLLDPFGGKEIRITDDGSETTFNGITDWIYEEEVFDSNHALWFSPGGTKLAYLRFDEKEVPIYQFPIYNNDSVHTGKTTPYNTFIKMKYPKPGYPNPIVSAHLVDLNELKIQQVKGTTSGKQAIDLVSPRVVESAVDPAVRNVDAAFSSAKGQTEKLVTEVAWLDDDSLYIRETDRVSDKMRGLVYDTKTPRTSDRQLSGRVVRRKDVQDRGWIPATQELLPVGAQDLSLRSSAYLEVLQDDSSFRHIAYFENATTSFPVFLTTGPWEVDRILFADVHRNKVYFTAAKPLPYHRHVFSVDLPSSSSAAPSVKDTLVDLTAAWPNRSFTASFDPKGAYYFLQDLGPQTPSARVIGIDDPSFEWVVEDNAKLQSTRSIHVQSQHVYYNVSMPNGLTTSTVQEIRPHDFDASGAVRYPVLFNVYNGPGAQKVSHEYKRSDWHEYLVNTLGYIVCIVDGRGTGYKGEQFSEVVTKHLGVIEVDDLIETAKVVRTLPYVDEKRLGIWGWSYGGYMAAKTIERFDKIITLGISVAPVTNWRFYDSIYVERYMKLPTKEGNAEGYEDSSVHVSEGFKKSHYLLAHGTGDDNVHFENSAHLLDMLTFNEVRGFWFRMFPDSNHGMSTRKAFRELHQYLTLFLETKWGAGGNRKFGNKEGKDGGRKALVEEHVGKEKREEEEDERVRRQEEEKEEVLRRFHGKEDL